MREYTKTKLSYKEVTDGEVSLKITSEEAYNRKVAQAQKDGTTPPEIHKKQTFRFVEAESREEAEQLAGGNTDIFLAHYNYGASLAQHNASNDLLTGDDFEPTEEVYNLEPVIAQKPEGRTKLTAEEKAVKALAKGGIQITADQLRAALAALQG